MKYTNKDNLPEFLFRALASSDDDYWLSRKGEDKRIKYSVSQIIKEPRPVILQKRYNNEIVKDITDLLWIFLGKTVHAFLEKGEGKNDLVEERLSYFALDSVGISGGFDYYESSSKTIYDIKVTSKYKVKSNDFYDWQLQLSIYAFLLRRAGFEVENIANLVFARDKLSRDDIQSITVINHDILEYIDGVYIQEWINEKIYDLESLKNVKDNELPECSEVYRWAKPDTYKVFKDKNKKSSGNFEQREDAEIKLKELQEKYPKSKFKIEFVEGNKFVRCEYCDASDFCNQYKKSKRNKEFREKWSEHLIVRSQNENIRI